MVVPQKDAFVKSSQQCAREGILINNGYAIQTE